MRGLVEREANCGKTTNGDSAIPQPLQPYQLGPWHVDETTLDPSDPVKLQTDCRCMSELS